MEPMRFGSLSKFGTKTQRFSKGKVGKACWFEGRTWTLKIYGVASLWKKNKTRFEISAFQRIRTSITFCYRWLVWQPQHDLCHIIISWTKQAIYVEKSLTITLKMVIGLFFNSIFDVLVTTLGQFRYRPDSCKTRTQPLWKFTVCVNVLMQSRTLF